MVDFAKLMERNNNLDAISEKMNKISSRQERQDIENVWKLGLDKAGNGEAIIRFMPIPEGEDLPAVCLYNHFFQGPGGWYVENSLTTLGKDDPMTEYNSELWNTNIEENRNFVRYKSKRQTNYYANIFVVSDRMNPDNNGKVLIYRFGQSIMDKLKEGINPQFDDERINPYDLINGADFRLRAYTSKDGWTKYDKSMFGTPGRLTYEDKELTDDELMALWKQCHSLRDIIAPDKFKSYNELKARMVKVLKLDEPNADSIEAQERDIMAELDDELPELSGTSANIVIGDDDDDDLDFFKKLASS